MGIPTWLKAVACLIIILGFAWIATIGYVIYTVVSDPKGAAQTIGEIGGAVVNGFENTVNENN